MDDARTKLHRRLTYDVPLTGRETFDVCDMLLTPEGAALVAEAAGTTDKGLGYGEVYDGALGRPDVPSKGSDWRLVDSMLLEGMRQQPGNRGQVHVRRNYSTPMIFKRER